MEMQHLKLTESTMGQYRHAWVDIRRFFQANHSAEYCEQLLQRFINEIELKRNDGSMKDWKWKINRKAALVLIEVANTGQFQWKVIGNGTGCATMEMETIRQQYIASLHHRNLSHNTIVLYDYVFRKLIEFTESETTNDLSSLTHENIQLVIEEFADICNRRSMATILPILRTILTYIHDAGFAAKDLSGVVLSGFVQKGAVASYISKNDQTALIKQIDLEPKRTKAIILLALKLGLRDCDICNLTFEKIDWRNDKIKLFQEKTEAPIALPLLPDVGNALMDYILTERPKRDDKYPYIFLRKQAPHNKLKSAYGICSKLFKKLEIEPVNGSSKGVHVFRYSLAYNLLAAKTPHQVITDVLGHVSKESDKPYLSMEENMLRLCALDLSVVGKVSWQGGM